jgi:hypothetical protein
MPAPEFIHSNKAKTRASSIAVALAAAFVVNAFKPWQPRWDYSGNALTFNVLMILVFALAFTSIGLWWVASRQPEPELPDPSKWTGPNQISLWSRVTGVLFALGLLTYATYGLQVDDIYLPAKRGDGVHFSGLSAWIMYGAVLCAAANLLTIVIDHYDKRNNERRYVDIAAITEWIGWMLFAASLIVRFVFRSAGAAN